MTRQVADRIFINNVEYSLVTGIELPINHEKMISLSDEEHLALFDDGDEERKLNLKRVNDEIESKHTLTGEDAYRLTDHEICERNKYTYISPAAGTYSSSCWRRYIATWEIKESKLYLRAVTGRFNLETDHPIFCDWYTGKLNVPSGELLHQDMMFRYYDVYEEELIIEILNGIVVSRNCIKHDKADYYRFTCEQSDVFIGPVISRGLRLRRWLEED